MEQSASTAIFAISAIYLGNIVGVFVKRRPALWLVCVAILLLLFPAVPLATVLIEQGYVIVTVIEAFALFVFVFLAFALLTLRHWAYRLSRLWLVILSTLSIAVGLAPLSSQLSQLIEAFGLDASAPIASRFRTHLSATEIDQLNATARDLLHRAL
jgi:hypothetical protein